MRIGEGVEWGAHVCLLLDWLGPDATVPAVKLAAAFELPAPYLNKQLQLLVRAGILESTRGGNGGDGGVGGSGGSGGGKGGTSGKRQCDNQGCDRG